MKEASAHEQFVLSHPAGNFFQSLAFKEFQEKIPYRGAAWLVEEKEASCLVIKMRLPFGYCWLWVPYGPLMKDERAGAEIFNKIAILATREKAIFTRIEPAEKGVVSGSRPAPSRFTPECSLVIDLEQSEDEILRQMKVKGRYNIKLAQRRGVRVKEFPNFHLVPSFDFAAWYGLLRETSTRDGFGVHPQYFYEKFLETFGEHHMASLFVAYDAHDRVIAGTIVVFYAGTATYYYGASSYAHRALMAPYLLQWTAMHEAKRRGMRRYDFLGIAPSDAKNHSWAGVTEFKKKFGGSEVHYPPAFDLVYRPFLYWVLRLLKKAR